MSPECAVVKLMLVLAHQVKRLIESALQSVCSVLAEYLLTLMLAFQDLRMGVPLAGEMTF